MYKIIVYELVIINVNVGNRIVKKKYFNKVYSLHNIASNEISLKTIELKQRYKEFKYIFSIIESVYSFLQTILMLTGILKI